MTDSETHQTWERKSTGTDCYPIKNRDRRPEGAGFSLSLSLFFSLELPHLTILLFSALLDRLFLLFFSIFKNRKMI